MSDQSDQGDLTDKIAIRERRDFFVRQVMLRLKEPIEVGLTPRSMALARSSFGPVARISSRWPFGSVSLVTYIEAFSMAPALFVAPQVMNSIPIERMAQGTAQAQKPAVTVAEKCLPR